NFDTSTTFEIPLALTQLRLGLTQNAILVTANAAESSTGTSLGGFAFFLAKPTLYLFGGGLFGWLEGLPSDPTPPNVLDGNPAAYVIAPRDSTHVTLVKMTNLDSPLYAGVAAINVAVSSYAAPPSAPQPGGGAGTDLETGDGRFGVSSTQY